MEIEQTSIDRDRTDEDEYNKIQISIDGADKPPLMEIEQTSIDGD